MERLACKIHQILEFLEGVDYRSFLKNIMLLLSFSIVHFFGYMYFAFEGIPPFVDLKSFSNVTFVAMGFLAIAGLASRLVTIAYFNFLLPYGGFLVVAYRKFKHQKIRRQRRLENGFVETDDVEILKARRHRGAKPLLGIQKTVLQQPASYLQLGFRYLVMAATFAFLYTDLTIATHCLGAIIYVSALVFLFYSFISIIVEGVHSSIEQTRNEDALRSRTFFQKVTSFVRVFGEKDFWMQLSFSHAKRRVARKYFFANIGLIIVISSLIFGAGRAAHTLGNYGYNVELINGHNTTSISVALVTFNGLLGVSPDDHTLLFLPLSSVISISPSEISNRDFYIQRMRYLLPPN